MSSNTDENENSLLVMSHKSDHQEPSGIRKSARDPRSRLLSDSTDELPKSILKNRSRIPTKRSVSECVDDLSQIMADLDITIDDISNATVKFCPHKHFFDECEEDTCRREEDDDDDEEDDDHYGDTDDDDDNDEEEFGVGAEANFSNDGDQLQYGKQRKCDCNLKISDNNSVDKPKKSVRFDEKVYETYFIASRLYDRRYLTKYHSSTRHHPPSKKQQNKKNKKKSSRKSEKKDEGEKSHETSSCKLSKSQRAKQSKKDKKKRLHKKEDVQEHSSDDQGYCSSTLHSFSD